MYCPYCGAQQEDAAKFCTSCGMSMTGEQGAGGTALPRPENTFTPPAVIRARTGEWISAGWDLVKPDLFLWMLMALVYLAIASAVPLILQGAFQAGLHYVCLKRLLGRSIEFGDMFEGFTYFVRTLLAVLLIALFTFLGTLACIVPGLVVAAMYMFTYLFIIDRKMDFWPSMQASHEIVKKDYLGFTLFFLALIMIQIVGVLACIVGLLVTIPIAHAAITVAYKEITGIASKDLD